MNSCSQKDKTKYSGSISCLLTFHFVLSSGLVFFLKNNRKVFVSVIEISSLESSMDDKLAQDENEII